MTADNTWFADSDQFSRWALGLRRMLLAANEIADALERPDGQRVAIVPEYGDPAEMARGMHDMAERLRRIAAAIEAAARAVETAECAPVVPGDDTPH